MRSTVHKQVLYMTKAARKSKKVMATLLLAIFAILFGANADQGWGRLSKEEDLELDQQLKLINKPAIKSFQTDYGDIVDCIDIYKQLAFDHPMLKNHTIQIKSTTMPEGMRNEELTRDDAYSQYMPKNIECPQGSVPIRRTTKEDLIMAKNYANTHKHSSTMIGIQSAVVEFKSQIYGGRGRLSIWNPRVQPNTQFSLGGMWVSNGPKEQIQAGWGVTPNLYPDSYPTRLYTYWTADGYEKTGCFNVFCPGFIQTSPEITLGLPLPSSTYRGQQYDILLSLHQDRATGNWWVMMEDKYIGYWPKVLFSSLGQGGSLISWGGEISSPLNVLSPPMGSGHFPEEGYGKSAYVGQIKVVTNAAYDDPADWALQVNAAKPYCYNARHQFVGQAGLGHVVYFGGPGNCTV